VDVAARIQALERQRRIQQELQQQSRRRVPLVISATPPPDPTKPNTPLIFPLHYKRFVRRPNQASPMSPASPVHVPSHSGQTVLQSPRPSRIVPFIQAPITNFAKSTVQQSKPFTAAQNAALGLSDGGLGWNFEKPLLLRSYGTRSQCVRHGRKQSNVPGGSNDKVGPRQYQHDSKGTFATGGNFP
jgi:hypothetical protein